MGLTGGEPKQRSEAAEALDKERTLTFKGTPKKKNELKKTPPAPKVNKTKEPEPELNKTADIPTSPRSSDEVDEPEMIETKETESDDVEVTEQKIEGKDEDDVEVTE